MPRAKKQTILSSSVKSEVDNIKSSLGVQIDDIDLCLITVTDDAGFIVLKGIYEIRRNGNFKKNLYKFSEALRSETNATNNIPSIMESIFYLKHKALELLSENTSGNLELEPEILNDPAPAGYLNTLKYKYEFPDLFRAPLKIELIDSILQARGNLFPSPPATGTNQ